jgi:hypothetical protein
MSVELRGSRGQSTVVGVAVLLGVTIVALAAVTASVGTVVQDSKSTADAARVAADFDDALKAVEATGQRRGHVSFTGGELAVEDRELRVLDDEGVVRTVEVDALVYRTGTQRVVYLAGAVVRATGGGTQLYASPPITASSGSGGVLVVGTPTLAATDRTIGGAGATTVALETDVSHDRTALGNGTFRVAVETTTPGAWERYFERAGATVGDRRDFDGDGIESVVARFPGERVGYLVVHRLDLEVSVRG